MSEPEQTPYSSAKGTYWSVLQRYLHKDLPVTIKVTNGLYTLLRDMRLLQKRLRRSRAWARLAGCYDESKTCRPLS